MGTYKIELILDGKSNIQKLMGDAGSSVKSGMNSIKNQTKSVNDGLSKVGNNAVKMGSDISTGSNKGASSLRSLGSSSTSTFGTIKAGAREIGTNIRDSISKGSSAGISALRQLGGTGASALKTIDGGIRGVLGGMGELETMLGAVIGGFGLMEIASMTWGGATQKQFNQLYLQTVMNKDEAAKYQEIIADIVADVPGDDTFMNALLTGALARQSNLTVEELKTLGEVTAYYTTISKQTMGGLDAEYQREIKDYILTGNTGLMQRDGLLKNQMGILEGKATVEDRIKAINEALTNEGYKQIPLMELSSTKAEEVKGKFQLAATEIGTRVLPHITSFLEFLIEIDEKTGGLSTQFMLIGGSVIALGGLLGMVYQPLSDAVGAAKDLAGWIKDKIPSTKVTTVKCVKDPSCEVGGTGTPGTGGKGGKSGTGASILPLAGKTLAGIVGGAVVGDALSNYVVGPAFSGISSLLGGGTPFKAYHGLLDVVGLGNQDYQVLNYNKQITENAKQYSQNKDLGKVDWSLFDSIKGAFWGKGQQKGTQSAVENVDWFRNNVFNKISTKGIGDWIQTTGLSNLSKGGLPGIISGWLPQFKWPSVNEIKESIMGKLPKINFKLPTASEIIQKFKEKIPKINWKLPTIQQIIDKVKEKIPKINWKLPSIPQIIQRFKEKIPKINWKLPTIQQIIDKVKEKIPKIDWKIPSVPQILSQTWQKITQLWWQIPGVGSLLNQTWQKIKELVWQVPSIRDILNIITSKITDFVWPMGPSPAGQGSGGGGGGAFRGPPRGPINNAIISTMSTKSGVGSDFIGQALANRFSGLAGFTPIADGIASRLGYTFYMGDQKSNQQVWDSGSCNCYDGAQFLQSEAGQRFGLSTGLSNGVWNGTSIPHTWSVIGGQPFDMAAKLIRGHWNPPSGPGSFDQFMTDIGPGLEYISYGGHRVNPYDAIGQGGNCFDMTLGVLGLARELWGLPGQMVWGHYDGMSHVWARIGNKDYDPTRRALVGSYNPPPQGPGQLPINSGGDTFIIAFNGTVYGVDDLESRTESMVKQVLDKREKDRRTFRIMG